ncbi:MAG TPA: cytochrome d ubiquinol oxidase subunit II [Xanthobacteraceae bacterium]|jgi:cytochrome d ubiquinol oxidase subunit II|nr:cytochrome d ubiquinol oxidase subunit II [Xanthobacteraceae bacterium]
MSIPFDYESLRVIWWLLLGVLLIGFAIMDGFDLGVAMLLPYVARTDTERRVMINAIGPVWEGNQVWLILGAGAIFAAWPPLYATAFSGFYIAMFLVLLSLIVRPVGFEFRNKFADAGWRRFWDYALFANGVVPSVVFGVAVGNLFQGVPFHIDSDLRVYYEGGGLFELLNPFGLFCGVLSAAMLATHGAVYLTLKTDGTVQARARDVVRFGAVATIVLFALAGLWLWFGIDGYAITSTIVANGPSNPTLKTVARMPHQWFANYGLHPWTAIAPIMGLAGPLLALGFTALRLPILTFIGSALGIFGIIATAGLSLFPFLMPSSTAPGVSLTVWDASSSRLTLFVMLVGTVLFLPLVIIYTAIVYRVLRGMITESILKSGHHY